jgi:hypothetical protein
MKKLEFSAYLQKPAFVIQVWRILYEKRITKLMEPLVELSQNIKPAVVSVCMPIHLPDGSLKLNILGTGFNVSPEGLVVTCQHVLEPYLGEAGESFLEKLKEATDSETGKFQKLQVSPPIVNFYFKKDEKSWAIIQKQAIHVQGSPKDDIAILEFPEGDFRPGEAKEYPFLELAGENEKEGLPIGVVGFPLGDTLQNLAGSATYSFHYGHIGAVIPFTSEEVQPTSYQLDVFTNHGNSGGPVFRLSDGKVIGMLNAGLATNLEVEAKKYEIPTGISFAVPSWKILADIEENKISGAKLFKELDKSLDD